MNIFKRFTMRSLKENKTRTLVTIIGIILSVAMFTATIEAFVTVESYLINYAEMYNGKYHVGFNSMENEAFLAVAEDERVKDYTYIQDVGYAEIGSLNEYKPYLYIAGIPSDFTEIMPIHLISGRLPENCNELVISEHLYLNGNVKLELGQEITLKVGQRQWIGLINMSEEEINSPDTNARMQLTQEVPFRTPDGEAPQEMLINSKEKTYTIVGFCLRPDESIEQYEAPGYTAYTINETDNNGAFNIYTLLNNPLEHEEFYSEIKEEHGIMWGEINHNLLMFSFQSFNSAFPVLVIGLMTILIGLIVFGSVSLIYNSFAISVSERTKQFGILKSIGATKKQIRKTVLYEAAVLCNIGIPAGLIAGCLGITVAFYCLSDSISTFLADLTDLEMRFVFSPAAIIAASLIGFATVIISAYIPARKAIKINPIDSVRLTNEIKIKRKGIKVSPLTGKIFGFEATLSSKNFKRNKRKYRTTVFSLFVSVVLFISASSLSTYFTDIVEAESQDMNYDVKVQLFDLGHLDVTGDVTVTEELVKKLFDGIKEIEGIEELAFRQEKSEDYDIDRQFISKEYQDMVDRERDFDAEQKTYLNKHFIYNIIDDASFKRLLKENGLDEKDYFNKNNPKALVYDKNTHIYQSGDEERVYIVSFLDSKKIPTTLEITKILPYFTENGITYYYFGQTEVINGITHYVYDIGRDEGEEFDDSTKRYLPESEALSYPKVSLGAVLKEKPYFASNGTNLIYPEYVKESVFKDVPAESEIYIITPDHKKVADDIEKLKKDIAGPVNNISITDYAAEIESTRALVTIAKVLAYGFIVLISLIAAANVFNTISTNISLRRREIATLKSVGLTRKGMIKMMAFESVLYGLKSLVFSLPVSLGITYIIWLVASDSGYYMSFYVPWDKFLIATLSVFIIVAVSMIYSVRKVNKQNTVETLRNENI